MSVVKRLFVFLCSLVLVACSNPQDPTKSNFKSAIQEYYSTQKVCFEVQADFPYQLAKSAINYNEESAVYDELVSIGLLEAKDTMKAKKTFFGKDPNKKEPATTYSLTEKSKDFVRKSEPNFFHVSGTEFCYGEYEVMDITNFSEPESLLGVRVTNVNFTYKVNKIEKWVKDSQLLQSEFTSVANHVASNITSVKDKATLMLTNNGWVHEKLFDK